MAVADQPLTGVRNLYPEQKRIQTYVLDTMRRVVKQFGYEEYDAPLLEPYSQPMTDTDQPAIVTDDRGRALALRQELTPAASRLAVAKEAHEYPYPLRWYSLPTVWTESWDQKERYERRQLAIDLLGVSTPHSLTEAIQLVDALLKTLDATQDFYGFRLSSYPLIRYILDDYLQLNSVQAATIRKLIARMPSMSLEAFIAELDSLFTPSQREAGADNKLIGLLKIKDIGHLPEVLRSQPAAIELQKLMHTLKTLHIPNVSFDLSIIQGTNHYSGIVFEAFDALPTNPHVIASGGHYESAKKPKSIPAVGITMGVDAVQHFLHHHGLIPEVVSETDIFIALASDVFFDAQRVIQEIRESEVNAIVGISGQDITMQLETARQKGLRYAITVHKQSLRDNTYELHNLHTGTVAHHSLARIVSIIKDYRRPADEV